MRINFILYECGVRLKCVCVWFERFAMFRFNAEFEVDENEWKDIGCCKFSDAGPYCLSCFNESYFQTKQAGFCYFSTNTFSLR
jgi:hypothetical protein